MLTIDDTETNKAFYDKTLSDIREASAISLHTPNGKDKPALRAELTAKLKELHQGWDTATKKVIYGGEMPDVAAWFELEKVFPLSSLEFEGISFPTPNDPSHYLNAIYSFDYRQLPPPHQRKIHAHSINFS